MRLFSFFAFVLLLPITSQAAEPGLGNFRVENELAVQQTGEKVKTTTLFVDGLVYDQIGEQGETTIFDKTADTFTLLEPVLRIQTQMSASELKEAVLQRRNRMRQETPPSFFEFALFPKFEEIYEAESGFARFQSPWIVYKVDTIPLHDDALLERYYDFCDWYCFLNLRVNPDSMTLFARMEVNRFLRERKRFPQKIQVDIHKKGNFGIAGIVENPDVYIGTHKLGARLIPGDQQRLQRIDAQRETFRTVSFEEYRREISR